MLGSLTGLTKATMVIVCAYNTATLILTETSLGIKKQNHFKHVSLLIYVLYVLFISDTDHLSTFYWVITHTETSTDYLHRVWGIFTNTSL